MKFVKLAHGSGGEETSELLKELLFSRVPDDLKKVPNGLGIDLPDDGAVIPVKNTKIVISTDSYTVNPPFFPGGNIGMLSAIGSINDVVVMGAKPIAGLDSIIVEEGFPVEDLKVITDSLIEVFKKESVSLVGGDFKVMPKGMIDRIVITTTVLGVAERPIVDLPKEGDKLVLTDYVGDHGAVIMMLQMGLESVEEIKSGALKSDAKPLTGLLPVIKAYSEHINACRDITRGGLGGVLNDWAVNSDSVLVIEGKLPIREQVRRYSEMLGIDAIYLASEGSALFSVSSEVAKEFVEALREHGFENAQIIGEVKKSEKYKGYVLMRTTVGGFRIVEPPRGELVPRIC
ncbi:MAG: hydrogenase expression/formation protein HypE [Archaeoglobaceae archaeon]|nr:hydrogenase expression/formation protein HypE [Archaeoglobaceae archaeon]MDW8117541.1 hydrogenase expression/formation protein HypE [Archaeoglobaceae archaeon]